MPVFQLPSEAHIFPNPEQAEHNGLIAIGGDLSVERLIKAYLYGFFPWFSEGDDILWWHPHERMVLFPDQLKVAKSMRPYFNQKKYSCTVNQCFEDVIRCCAEIKREDQDGTWILDSMRSAYIDLHKLGYAHSVEVWQGDLLVGGLYGLALGKVFYGESMFSRASNASKFGFIYWLRLLKERGFELVDCQQETAHLSSLGARIIQQEEFLEVLERNRSHINEGGSLKMEFPTDG